MKISELLAKLGEVYERYGDVGVSVNTHDVGESLSIIAVSFSPNLENIILVGR